MVPKELRKQYREELVYHQTALGELAEAQRKEKVLGHLFEGRLEELPDSLEMVRVREYEEPLDQIHREPHVEELRGHLVFDPRQLFDELLPPFAGLVEVDRLLLLLYVV